VERYKALKLDEEQGRKTINNHLTALRKLLNLALEWEVLERAPRVRGFRLKHQFVSEDEYLTFEEADRFVRAAAPEWRPFLVVALKTGLRVGELLALKWQDIDLVAAHLIVRRTLWRDQEGSPKGARIARSRSRTRLSRRSRRTGTSGGRTSSACPREPGSRTRW
jgi:integrase